MAQGPQPRADARTSPISGLKRAGRRLVDAIDARTGRYLELFLGLGTTLGDHDRATSNIHILRMLVATGYFLGALTMLGAGLFGGDLVRPVVVAWVYVGVFGAMAVLLVVGRRLPIWLVKFVSFELTVILLCVLIALAEPTYVVLLYFNWPALTASYFGTRRDVMFTMALLTVGLPVALAFGTIPVPVLAYVGTMGVMIFSVGVLRTILSRAVELFADLERMAATDPLTGLLNRRAATVALDQAIARTRRELTQISIATFDIDHFKQINDRFGHPAGDDALRRFADVLRSSCSATDVAARLGGEEFLVLLLRSDEAGARAFADRFIDALDRETADDPTPLSVSAGVAALSPAYPDSTALMVAADRALYAAKEAGRHQVVAATDTGVQPLAERV